MKKIIFSFLVLAGTGAQANNSGLLSAGYFHTCAINDNGVTCWGSLSTQSNVPQLQNPKQVSAGGSQTCALDDNEVKCWGSNLWGQLNVPKLQNPKQISSGLDHTCALDDNEVKCWGFDRLGQLNVPKLQNPKQISAGESHTCALDDNGVKCWGSNNFGQLNVPELQNPKQVSAGGGHTCALDDNGVKCWGNNVYGQLNVPKLTFGPTLQSPQFKLETIATYFKVLAYGSAPSRTAFFTTLANHVEADLAEKDFSGSFKKFQYQITLFTLVSLVKPAIVSGDSSYYLEKVIPTYNESLEKIQNEIGIRSLSDVPGDMVPVRKSVLKIMQSSLSVMNQFLPAADKNKVQMIMRHIGRGMANPQDHKAIVEVIKLIQAEKSLWDKLSSSSKTAFLVQTLMLSTEWLDKRVR